LEPGRRHADVPALPFLAQPVEGGDAHVFEEDLGEADVTVDLADRVAGNALLIEPEEDQAHALVALAARLTEQAEGPVGEGRAARPDLVAIEHVIIALAHGGRANPGKVGPGLRLGPGLGPDLLAAGH